MHVSRPYRVGIIAALALLCMAPNPAAARTSEKSPKTPEIAGDIAAVALPAAGLIVSLAVGDRQGVKQLALACAADLAVGYGLKYAIGKSRPAGHEGPAFPSIHSAVAFAGASYIQRRYGWKFGAPAYALAVYVGWSRIGAGARKHDISSDLRTRPTGRLACRTKANAAMSVIQKIVHPRGLIAKPIRQ